MTPKNLFSFTIRCNSNTCLHFSLFLCLFSRLWGFYRYEISDLQSKLQLHFVPHVLRLQDTGERSPAVNTQHCRVALYLSRTNPDFAPVPPWIQQVWNFTSRCHQLDSSPSSRLRCSWRLPAKVPWTFERSVRIKWESAGSVSAENEKWMKKREKWQKYQSHGHGKAGKAMESAHAIFQAWNK